MSTPDLERLARETGKIICNVPDKGLVRAHLNTKGPEIAAIILSALRTAQQEAQNEDTARLDWLGKNYDEGCGRPPCLDVYAVWAAGISLRVAIDQARREGK